MARTRTMIALAGFLTCLAGCVATPDPNAANIARERQAAQEPDSMLRIGDAARAQGDLKTAAAFYGRACALRPHDIAYVTPYAETLAQTGQLGEAMTAIRNARAPGETTPSPRAVLLEARLLTTADRPQDAIAVLDAALAHHPDIAGLHIARGVALDIARQFGDAHTAYLKALALEPGNTAARNDLALSRALAGEPREGLARLLELRSDAVERGLPEATIATIDGNLAIVYALLGDQTKARLAGLGAVQTDAQAQANARFYSRLSPGTTGGPDRSGLSAMPD